MPGVIFISKIAKNALLKVGYLDFKSERANKIMGLTSSAPAGNVEETSEFKWVEERIAEHPVVVFSKSTCPYCSDAKKILDKTVTSYKAHEINRMDNTAIIQDALQHKTGARTVPRIFIDGQSVGGCSELKQLHSSGRLMEILTKMNAAGES